MNTLYSQCSFLLSAHNLSQLPEDKGTEIAFAGRSNAGKSSALNRITQSKSLARVSRTPGRTQLINYFKVADNRYLVDLPGYGYAKVPEAVRRHWHHALQLYFTQRRSLAGLFLIMDIRHPLQPLDWQMLEWSTANALKLHIVLTKADKLSKGAASSALHQTHKALEQAGFEATLQIFSAHLDIGIDDTHTILDEWFGYQ